jgi:2-oxoglutarate ferredoxin oxidoreductase subunit alpha
MEPESAAAQAAGAGPRKRVEEREEVVIRFAGDSGDGMQLAGMYFTNETALAGNDLSTLPDFPAEIRAPAGTLAGVSGFQLHFSSRDVFTPGDAPDVLVAMNPAALKVNIGDLEANGILIVDKEQFNEQNLKKAEFAANPLTDGSLDRFQVFPVDITKLTINALKDMGLATRTMMRSRNFFALGLTSWLFGRPIEPTLKWIEQRFKKTPSVGEANAAVLKAGWNFGETAEMFRTAYTVRPATIAPGRYRNITGNTATALGFVAAARRAGRPLFLGSYPITPASDILHELSTLKNFDVHTFQAETEKAGIGAALGAAFGGAIALTTTSGPGVCLKAEALNLAISTELPLIIADIQRGGPSTGLPTKTEQADLMLAMFGRNSDSPIPILAPSTPADCFAMAFEAVRIAVTYMTPVFLLSDGYLANGAEPWLVPRAEDLPAIPLTFRTEPKGYFPYLRDPETLARPWAIPGTPGLEHRIGG